MKRLKYALAVSACLFFANMAFAAGDNNSGVAMTGNVSKVCTLSPFLKSTNMVFGTLNNNVDLVSSTSGNAVLNFTNIANSSTANYNAGSYAFLQTTMVCNFATQAVLKSTRGSLRIDSGSTPITGSAAFNTKINYRSWFGGILAFNGVLTANTNVAIQSTPTIFGPTNGSKLLTIQVQGVDDPTKPLLAGTYSDVMVLTITPQ